MHLFHLLKLIKSNEIENTVSHEEVNQFGFQETKHVNKEYILQWQYLSSEMHIITKIKIFYHTKKI